MYSEIENKMVACFSINILHAKVHVTLEEDVLIMNIIDYLKNPRTTVPSIGLFVFIVKHFPY